MHKLVVVNFESGPRYDDFDSPDQKIRKALSIGMELQTLKENASEYAYHFQQSETYLHAVHQNHWERQYRKFQDSYSQWELNDTVPIFAVLLIKDVGKKSH